ncbi:MAG: IS110 family transposase [Nanoarchaeota archaeon]|nr:IS110 family transposase [Nanoarchaeota archaeon]
MNIVGPEVHKCFTYGVVKNEQGEVLNKSRFENSEENFDSFLHGFKPEETKIVMESTSV